MSLPCMPPRSAMALRDRTDGRIRRRSRIWPSAPCAGSPGPLTGRLDRWHQLARAVLFAAAVVLFTFPAPDAARAGDGRDESDIRAVANAFRQAIVDKNSAAFTALFLDPSTATWISVESDARLAAAQASGCPAGDKVLAGPERTPLSFIQGIVRSPGRHDETMENLRIATDGEIASVHFDFAYLYDGRAITTGEEAWLLVRTADGWRIVSVVWSKR
jgi:hypothetical protein